MKITVLTTLNSRSNGGIFYAVKDLAFSLWQNKCDINILSHNDKYSAEDIAEYQNIPMSVYHISNLYPLKKTGFSVDIHKILKSLKSDIIHQQGIWQYHSYASLKYKKNNPNTKTIISPHGMLDAWAINRSSFIKKIIGLLYENKNLKKADCIHALCQSEYESIRTFSLKNPVAVIPNGTAIPEWKRMYAEKEKRTVLFLGRIHPKKGIKEFITAVYLLNKRNSAILNNWNFKIAGWSQDGHQEELQKLINEYQLTDYFEFVGSLYGTAKEKALKDADAFVLPSFSEGMPMAVLEAWAYGLPVIMTDFCNIPEGFKANAAFRIDVEPKKMSRQLEMFLAFSQMQLSEMGNNGYNLVKNEFSWEVVAKKMIQLYNWILNGGEKPEFVYE